MATRHLRICCAQDMQHAQLMAWCFSCFLLEIMAEHTTQETENATLVIDQNPEMEREALVFLINVVISKFLYIVSR